MTPVGLHGLLCGFCRSAPALDRLWWVCIGFRQPSGFPQLCKSPHSLVVSWRSPRFFALLGLGFRVWGLAVVSSWTPGGLLVVVAVLIVLVVVVQRSSWSLWDSITVWRLTLA